MEPDLPTDPQDFGVPDWSTGPWERSCRTRLVRQRRANDCGVACLAMVTGKGYKDAASAFTDLGLDSGRRPMSSNFTKFRAALRARGFASEMLRWRGWEHFSGLGVLKVKSGTQTRNWHWVVAESHSEYGFVLRNPAWPLVTFGEPPMNACNCKLLVVPSGSWIRILTNHTAVSPFEDLRLAA